MLTNNYSFVTGSNFNITDLWIENIFEQISNGERIKHQSRPVIIEIDFNMNMGNLDENFTEYLMTQVKKQIKISFNLFSTTLAAFFVIAYAIIICFGMITNILMIFAFFKAKGLRTFRNYYIINLAVSDILVCSICAPLTLYRTVDVKWDLGRLLCKIGPGLQASNVIVTAFSITAIALDRWDFIANKGKNSTKRFIVNSCLFLIWILAFILTIPLFITNDLKIIQNKMTKEILYSICEELWLDFHEIKPIYSIFLTFFQYILPVIIIASSNYKICNFLRYHVKSTYSKHTNIESINKKKKLSKKPSKNSGQKLENGEENSSFKNEDKIKIEIVQNNYSFKNDRKFAKSKNILLLVSLSFTICWAPLLLFNIYLDFTEEKSFTGSSFGTKYLSSHLIAMTSCCINPILYGLENTNFKQELRNIVSTYFSTNATKVENDELPTDEKKTFR